MDNIKRAIDGYIKNKEYTKAIEKLTDLIEENQNIDKWLIIRADIYNIKQQYSKALNDYNKVLKLDPNNRSISSKVEMIKEILKFQARDIYASTNLNMDPWLDD